MLVIFLPPLLYAAAFFSSLRDLRDNVRPIGLLAIGLVVFTTLGVGVVAHAVVDDLSWAAAFTLGAIALADRPGGGDRDRVARRVRRGASSRSSRASRWSTTRPR